MIDLYFMRHGEATPSYQNDHLRELTKRGVEQALKQSNNLYNSCKTIDLALVSPYIRAEQTFNLAIKNIKYNKKVILNELTPNSDPKTSWEIIKYYIENINTESKTVLLVAHMPILGYLYAIANNSNPVNFELAQIMNIKKVSLD